MQDYDKPWEQYNQVDWANQRETQLNKKINQLIVDSIPNKELKLFDMGCGIGFFIEMINEQKPLVQVAGCEPSIKSHSQIRIKGIVNTSFLEYEAKNRFDILTSIYVFPHIPFEELELVAHKINTMLVPRGKFILVIANDNFLKQILDQDRILKKETIKYQNKGYIQILHKSKINKIGTVIDYNRSEVFYKELFENNGFTLAKKQEVEDNGFISTVMTFELN